MLEAFKRAVLTARSKQICVRGSDEELCCWNIQLLDWLISSKAFWAGTGNIYAAVSCLGNLYVCDIPDCGMWTSQRFRTFRLQVRHLWNWSPAFHIPSERCCYDFCAWWILVLVLVMVGDKLMNVTLTVCQHYTAELVSKMNRNESLKGLSKPVNSMVTWREWQITCSKIKRTRRTVGKSKCLRCEKLWKQSLELNITMMHEDFLRLSNNTSAKAVCVTIY